MTQSSDSLFRVQVTGLVENELVLQYSDFTSGKLGPHLDVTLIVSGFTGIATPVQTLFELIKPLSACTHVIFHASDEFQATIPLDQLGDALLLFQQDGLPLKKGFPVRLLVPNGSSECLNVKAVVKIECVQGDSANEEATYGFKNLVKPSEL